MAFFVLFFIYKPEMGRYKLFYKHAFITVLFSHSYKMHCTLFSGTYKSIFRSCQPTFVMFKEQK